MTDIPREDVEALPKSMLVDIALDLRAEIERLRSPQMADQTYMQQVAQEIAIETLVDQVAALRAELERLRAALIGVLTSGPQPISVVDMINAALAQPKEER